MHGQEITTGPNHFYMTRYLLEGKVITDFEDSIKTHTYSKTVHNLELVLVDVTQQIFAKQAIEKICWALPCDLRKPENMSTAEFYNRIMNNEQWNGEVPRW